MSDKIEQLSNLVIFTLTRHEIIKFGSEEHLHVLQELEHIKSTEEILYNNDKYIQKAIKLIKDNEELTKKLNEIIKDTE